VATLGLIRGRGPSVRMGGVAKRRFGDIHPSLEDMSVVFEVQTFYEKMFLEMGLPITYMAFTIGHEGPYVFPGEAFDHEYWLEAEGPRRTFSHQPQKQ